MVCLHTSDPSPNHDPPKEAITFLPQDDFAKITNGILYVPFRLVILWEAQEHHPTIIIKKLPPISTLIVLGKGDLNIPKLHQTQPNHIIPVISMDKTHICLA